MFALYLQQQLHLDAPAASLFLGLAGAIGAAMQIFAVDRLERRFGAQVLSEASFAMAFVAYGLLGLVANVAVFLAVLALWAISGSTLRPTLSKLLADKAPEKERGAALGLADSLDNASMILAPAIGAAIVSANARLSGILPALCVALAFALGARGTRSSRPRAA